MTRESPAFRDAARDRTIRGNAFFVYVWCDEHLDPVEFRYVKHSQLEKQLGLSDSSISDAIARLVERGYLAVGPRSGRTASYRLYHSRPSSQAIPVQTGKVTTP
jgi:hypothetical protein